MNFLSFKILTVLLLAFVISTTSFGQSDTTFVPENKGYKLVYKDEFNTIGTPNLNDWLFRVNKKFGGASVKENVFQGIAYDGSKNGCLLIPFTYDSTLSEGNQFKGGGVVSTHNFGYGYYETRVKLYGGSKELSGLHQSFWSMGLTGTNEGEGKGVRDSLVNADLFPQENRVLEIDGFEQNSKDNILSQNYHIYTPTHLMEAPKNSHIKQDLSQWIVIGYEWLPDRINFYCNGKYSSTKFLNDKWKVYAPQNFWLTALPVNLKSWGGLVIPPKNAAMQVDYFRFYTKKQNGINLIGNNSFEYGAEKNTYPIAWIASRTKANIEEAIKVVTDSAEAKEGKRFLEMKYAKSFKASTKQILEFIPNGEYNISAWVKCSKGNKASLLANSGTNKKVIQVAPSNEWKRVDIKGLKVIDNKAIIEFTCDAAANESLKVDNVEFVLN